MQCPAVDCAAFCGLSINSKQWLDQFNATEGDPTLRATQLPLVIHSEKPGKGLHGMRFSECERADMDRRHMHLPCLVAYG
jgi:hypothetical protein